MRDVVTPPAGSLVKSTNVRWIVGGLMWLAIAINYIDRTVLSAAAPHLSRELSIPADQMGFILSAFFWSYALLQIPAGWFADRFGQKIGLGASVALWSIATSATGLAAGFYSLFAMRLGLGIGEAGAYPSNAGIASKWFPDRERATISGLFDSASKFGGAIAMPLIVWLIALIDWRMTFVVIGAIGMVWAIVWWWFFTETPEAHPMMNKSEVDYIRHNQIMKHGEDKAMPMRWYELLRYRNIWAMCLGFFTINYISYFFITWLPTYLVKQKGMGMMEMGFVASLPLLCGLVAEIVAGLLSDRIVRSKRLSLTATRKLFLIAGLTMALCIGLAAIAESVWFAVALLCIAKAGTTVAASQVWALPGDVAPKNMTSVVAGLQNMVSNFGGVLGPIITGFIVAQTGSFNAALLFSAGVGFLGILNYALLLGKVRPIQAPI
ncbi:Major facilitator superfamily MFS_1 [Bradyrhizobium sp. STM 3843]|uniref:MFS transporter n=1 Tax=Bradyrhizobium sp. STM 3843 TaxID=551947 RepID=UPI000240A4BD|nr:MFS transporter [Bradyrhizobium sp. STM 3843]CCE05971.1 Major facilitator superfamily MFS_1 [Bradyrhizobium sp. STM 3843]